MSQAGLTRADMAQWLELNGWTREPRPHGAPLLWVDPLGGRSWRTEVAYDMEIERRPRAHAK